MLGFEAQFACNKRKKRSKKELECDEIKAILDLVLKKAVSQREAAQRFGVKPHLVMSLVRNERLKQNTVAQLEEKQAVRRQRHNSIKDAISAHVESNWHIWTAQQVRETVMINGGPSVKHSEVRQVMRSDFNMRYRVLKKAAY